MSKSGKERKIEQAKKAAIYALEHLSPEDIVSVVLYDSEIEVLLPATRLTQKENIIRKINEVEANGTTAIYAGVRQGEKEIKKYIKKNKINRIILLSDGKANVGPSKPDDFEKLGSELVKDGISVTTMGLGLNYNEDLMKVLAEKSNGVHYFVENAEDQVKAFQREFKTIFSAVAQEVVIKLDCAPGVRPVKLLGRSGTISGGQVEAYINQLYHNNEKYILLELDIDSGPVNQDVVIASLEVSFRDAKRQKERILKTRIKAQYNDSADRVNKNENREVMIVTTLQIATEKNIVAMKVRDSGDIETAKKLLLENAAYLQKYGDLYDSDLLRDYGKENRQDSEELDEYAWKRRRKAMAQSQGSQGSQSETGW